MVVALLRYGEGDDLTSFRLGRSISKHPNPPRGRERCAKGRSGGTPMYDYLSLVIYSFRALIWLRRSHTKA